MKRLYFFLFLFPAIAFSAPNKARIKIYEDYIQQYAPLAMKQQVLHGIPASITLAQGLLESNAGNSTLAKESNNHFGIKCHSNWKGDSYSHFDDGEQSCFRKYTKVADSYEDHSLFLCERERYASLFSLNIHNYKAWAKGLKEAGYATDRLYAQKLINIIELYHLDQYDKLAGKKRVVKKMAKRQKKEGFKDYNDIALHAQEKQITRNQKNERTDNLPQAINATSRHELFYRNGVAYIFVRYGDSYAGLCDEFGLSMQQLLKMNDLPKGHRLNIGEMLFLGKKHKTWSGEKDVHIVREEDSMHSIAQQYGIRVKSLFQLNGMDYTDRIQVGQKLKLR